MNSASYNHLTNFPTSFLTSQWVSTKPSFPITCML